MVLTEKVTFPISFLLQSLGLGTDLAALIIMSMKSPYKDNSLQAALLHQHSMQSTIT